MIMLFGKKTTIRRLRMKTEASILENSAYVSFKTSKPKITPRALTTLNRCGSLGFQ